MKPAGEFVTWHLEPQFAGLSLFRAKLNAFLAAVRREAEGAETDPFDDAMIAAVVGLAETMRAESVELAALRERMVRLARQVPR